MAGGHLAAREGLSRPPAPALIAVLSIATGIATILPLLYLGLRSLGAGTEAWSSLLTPRTGEILGRSLLLVAAVTAVAILLGLPIAWLTTRTDLPFRRVWLTLATLPLVVPTYIAGMVLVVALGPRGLLQRLLEPLGVSRLPEIYGFPGALLILGLHTYPYVLLNTRAALLRLDSSVEEASYSLGRGRGETFWRIVLPQLRPAIAAGALLSALYTLGDFGAVSLLNYETFTWAIFIQYQSAFDRSVAASLSLVLVLLAAIILVAEARTRPSWQHGRASVARSARPLRLGRWRWVSVLFCATPTVLGVLLPVALLASWALQGAAVGEASWALSRAGLNSIGVGSLAALLAVAAALPLAILSVRFPGRLSGILERTTYVGFALPRIAIALGLVFFGAMYARPLYQTVSLLIFAYVILFLPTALGSLSAALRQVPRQLEEAARSLGRRPHEVLLTITLPRMRPGVLAGAALVFLLTLEELPATLILRPAGLDTLATAVWSAATEALFTEAAVPALLLVLVSAVSVALLHRQEPR